MADDAHDERFRQHEAILEGLARMLAAQHGMHQRGKGCRQRAALEHLDTTQSHSKTLLVRRLPPGENGRDACPPAGGRPGPWWSMTRYAMSCMPAPGHVAEAEASPS